MDLVRDHLLLLATRHAFLGVRCNSLPLRSWHSLGAGPRAVSRQRRPTLSPGNRDAVRASLRPPSGRPSPLPRISARRPLLPRWTHLPQLLWTNPGYRRKRERTGRPVTDPGGNGLTMGSHFGQSFPKKDFGRSQKPLPL